MEFRHITFDILKNAIEIYLKIAYPTGIREKSFCYNNILKSKEAKNISQILSVFEKEVLYYEGARKKIRYSGRFGSERYPYLKLVLQEGNKKNDFGFLVDRHTEYLALLQSSISYKEENEIKAYTREIKYKIEDEFERNQIPTFREMIRNETKQLRAVYKKEKSNYIRVLIVDDDLDLLELIRLNLEMMGYEVTIATNGEEALEKAFHEIHDVMILDLMMSGMSGFDVIKFASKKIPIIVLTALIDSFTREKCLEEGAIEVVIKPVEIGLLDKLIKKVIKNS